MFTAKCFELQNLFIVGLVMHHLYPKLDVVHGQCYDVPYPSMY